MALIATTGERCHSLTLKAPAPGAVDARGHGPESFVDVATVWGAADPIRGREYFAAGQEKAAVEVRFRIGYRVDVLASWRVRWRGQDYELRSPPIDTLGQRRQLELMASAVAGSGVAP